MLIIKITNEFVTYEQQSNKGNEIILEKFSFLMKKNLSFIHLLDLSIQLLEHSLRNSYNGNGVAHLKVQDLKL